MTIAVISTRASRKRGVSIAFRGTSEWSRPSSRVRIAHPSRLARCHGFDFDQGVGMHQLTDDGRASGAMLAERAGVSGVESRKVAGVTQPDSGLDHILGRQTRLRERRRQITERQSGLTLDVLMRNPALCVKRQLSGDKDEPVNLHEWG